ncbi:hypothetical protein IWX90DRAFT_435667 [Phyllosticta citrichinensis]|uniref:Heme oxygenase-like protein n=1 Tax=Phyllosticta citrichinensis TaxID=1130410 RepID=A0ABR1XQK3_9PEZI
MGSRSGRQAHSRHGPSASHAEARMRSWAPAEMMDVKTSRPSITARRHTAPNLCTLARPSPAPATQTRPGQMLVASTLNSPKDPAAFFALSPLCPFCLCTSACIWSREWLSMTPDNLKMPLPPGSPSPSLAVEINTATRPAHTSLNRLITTRLPLGLPPHAASPRLYAFGILHFAHLFFTFESCWLDLTRAQQPSNPTLSSLLEDPWISVNGAAADDQNPSPSAGAEQSVHDREILNLLARLLPPGLPRSKRLRTDLATLLSLSPIDLDVHLAAYPTPLLATTTAHIRRRLRRHPHLLLAYTHVLYLAIFAGGRWIRQQLLDGGPEFWGYGAGDDEKKEAAWKQQVTSKGLSLWFFDGAADGEDIRSEFKRRWAEVEGLLSAEQRDQVVDESRHIFAIVEELVRELDRQLDTPGATGLRENDDKEIKDVEEKGDAIELDPVAQRVEESYARWAKLSRRSSFAGALVLLGGFYWWAACCLGLSLGLNGIAVGPEWPDI